MMGNGLEEEQNRGQKKRRMERKMNRIGQRNWKGGRKMGGKKRTRNWRVTK